MKEIENLNDATVKNLFNSQDFSSLCKELALPNNDDNYLLLQREVTGQGPKGLCTKTTLSPYAMILLTHDKATKDKYNESCILNTSFVWLRYPYIPEAGLSYLNNPSEYLTKIGGIFPEFKIFLKQKITSAKDFNTFIALPDGHLSLIVCRFEEEKSKLFIVDSVGSLMKNKQCLLNTCTQAFEEIEFAQNNYSIYHPSATRQNDFYSCPHFAMKDLKLISKNPELLKEIELKATDDSSNTSCKVYKQFPAHFMKGAQIIMFKGIDGMQDESFKNNKGTLKDHLKKANHHINHAHHGEMWLYTNTDEDLDNYLNKAYNIIENFDYEKTLEVFSSMYVDLYNQPEESALLGTLL